MYRHLYAFTIPICTTLAKPRG